FGVSAIASREPVALYELLDRYAAISHRWEHQGSLIRLRSRQWFYERPREVPLRLVRRWQALLEAGALPVEEDRRMVSVLTGGQLESLGDVDEEAGLPSDAVDLGWVYPARHALRLYASLSPGQRQRLWRGGTLWATELAPPQRQQFLAAVCEAGLQRLEPAPEP